MLMLKENPTVEYEFLTVGRKGDFAMRRIGKTVIANFDIGESVTPESEVVAIWFDKVKAGQSVRLRIEETYTDPNRYILYNDEFIFDRSFGRPFNTVVLPAGWFLTANAVPVTISLTPEGNISLYYVNSAPEDIDVLIRGRKR
jgi:hypothetical protein